MTTLVLLCGQGSIGKSTYGQKLQAKKNNSILIRIDECFPNVQNWDLRQAEYVKRIQAAIDLQYNYIICDACQDSPYGRALTLTPLILSNCVIELVIIHLRPPLEQLIQWSKQRNIGLYQQYKQIIPKVYTNYRPALQQEFQLYQFQSVSIYEIDNANKKIISGDKNAIQWLV